MPKQSCCTIPVVISSLSVFLSKSIKIVPEGAMAEYASGHKKSDHPNFIRVIAIFKRFLTILRYVILTDHISQRGFIYIVT